MTDWMSNGRSFESTNEPWSLTCLTIHVMADPRILTKRIGLFKNMFRHFAILERRQWRRVVILQSRGLWRVFVTYARLALFVVAAGLWAGGFLRLKHTNCPCLPNSWNWPASCANQSLWPMFHLWPEASQPPRICTPLLHRDKIVWFASPKGSNVTAIDSWTKNPLAARRPQNLREYRNQPRVARVVSWVKTENRLPAARRRHLQRWPPLPPPRWWRGGERWRGRASQSHSQWKFGLEKWQENWGFVKLLYLDYCTTAVTSTTYINSWNT